MTIRQGGCDLSEVGPNRIFAQMDLIPPASTDDAGQITLGAILHEDVEHKVLLVDVTFEILDDVFVTPEVLEYVDLFTELPEIAFVHATIVEFLTGEDEAIGGTFDLTDDSKRAGSDDIEWFELSVHGLDRARARLRDLLLLGLFEVGGGGRG